MKISDHPCPVCHSTNLWPQRGSAEETANGIGYRVCQNSNCYGRIKVKWNAEKEKIEIIQIFGNKKL